MEHERNLSKYKLIYCMYTDTNFVTLKQLGTKDKSLWIIIINWWMDPEKARKLSGIWTWWQQESRNKILNLGICG